MTRVIKVGGRVQASPELAATLAGAWRESPRALCVVHGGGDAVSSVQRALGAEPTFVEGRRATTAADVAVLRMVLSGLENKRLVASLTSLGVPAVGISGEDGSLIVAEQDGEALGLVGTPTRVNAALLRHLLAGGFLPVVSPVSASGGAGAATLNVNADDAAAAIAVAWRADELLFVADVPGVLLDGEPLPELTTAGATDLLARGVAAGGMAAKLRAAQRALAAGVAMVRIGDLQSVEDSGRGTRVTGAVRRTRRVHARPSATRSA